MADQDSIMNAERGVIAPGILAAALLLTGCQTTGETLAALDGNAGALKPPQVAELSGGSAFVTLNTRSGSTQAFALLKADKPVASVLLFAGGSGTLKLVNTYGSRPGMRGGGQKGNFLIRSMEEFVSRGLNAVLIDAPSDKQGSNGMRGGFRNSSKHVKDLEGVIAFVRKPTGLPVWLAGTSRGTESAAFAAIHSREPVDGLVLTSPVTVSNGNGNAVTSYALEKIRAPVQIVFHEKDGCSVTPPSGAGAIARTLVGAAKVEVKAFDGGGPPISGPCDAKSEHGFLGIESRVVDAIAAFIKANL